MLHLVRSDRFLDHEPGYGHPERPERLMAIGAALDEHPLDAVSVPLRAATDDEILSLHAPEHLARLEAARGRAGAFDADTPVSFDSVEVARLAVGATVDMVRAVVKGRGHTGFSLVRPPGHHAVPSRAMGFCLLGNLGLAARAMLDSGLVERIAIYDWDVHHGNGTQDMFFEDPRVLFVSTHQAPFYPGTGTINETGRGPGEGSTLNLPLSAGTTGTELLELNDEVILPRVRTFAPDLILISAGYDAHEADPLGGLRVQTDDYRQLALRWRELAESVCEGRIAGVLEGGYDLQALAASVRVTLEAWA